MTDAPLINAETAAAFASMVTQAPEAVPAAPVSPVATVAPVAPVVTEAAPAAAPAAGGPVTLEDLAELQKQTIAALQSVTPPKAEATPVAPVAPAGPSPERQALIAERQQLIDEADSPAIARALKAGFEAEDKADAANTRMDRMEQKQAESAGYEAAVQGLLDDSRALIEKFPGLTEPDMKKVFDAIAADKSPVPKSLREVAEDVLGFDFLVARRTPLTLPPGTPPGPPSRPPATVVDITGSGGGGPAAAPVSGGPGAGPAPKDVREVFAQILSSPSDRALLGKSQ